MNCRSAWSVTLGLVALTGVLVAVLSNPLAVTAGMVTVGLVMGGALGYALQLEERPGRAGRVLRFAGASAVGLVSLIGLTTLLGTAVYAVLGLLALTSPHLWTRVRTMTRPRRHNQPTHETSCPDPGEHEQPDQPPGFALPLQPPCSLSDETLCQAWSNTHRLLQKPLPPHVRVDVVQFRQACLDELEHRHPEEVSAWLATGAPPTENPVRYFT